MDFNFKDYLNKIANNNSFDLCLVVDSDDATRANNIISCISKVLNPPSNKSHMEVIHDDTLNKV
jgi:hypothetical protein